jgi:L-arabinose isomerase
VAEALPRIGLLGIMQALYDDMLPGITERQAAYAQELADALAGEADVVVAPPARDRDAIDRAVREFSGLDGLLVVMLTYGPAMRVARALADTRLPICLVNVQPEGEVTAAWDMADLTYNQGIHGAQDTANAMVRSGRPFHVITDDWRSPSFAASVGEWARAAAVVVRWRSLRVGVFGYAMNGMGDIRVDVHTMMRELGPEVVSLAPGELVRAVVGDDEIAAVIAFEDAQFEIDPRLSRAEREDHVRMQLAIQRVLDSAGCRAYSTHFGAIAEDGRFSRLPLAAASSLMAEGVGYAAEGDALTAALMCAARTQFGDTQFTEMYAMDFATDSILMSHMGEGNWRLAAGPVRLIKRPLGIGGLDDPPTFLFQYATGPATLATFVALGDRFRLVVSEGEILEREELPKLEMPYGFFRPVSGVRECMNGWLRLGGPHHQVLNPGHTAGAWEVFGDLAGIEVAQV